MTPRDGFRQTSKRELAATIGFAIAAVIVVWLALVTYIVTFS